MKKKASNKKLFGVQELTKILDRKNNERHDKDQFTKIVNSQERTKVIQDFIGYLHELTVTYRGSHEDLILAIHKIADGVKSKPIAFPTKAISNNQYIYYRAPIKGIYCKVLEPAIEKCFPRFSEGYFLFQSEGLWPFDLSHLDHSNLMKKINHIQQTLREKDGAIEDPNLNPSTEYLVALESLMLISDALFLIVRHTLAEGDMLTWCSLCFRRADEGLTYCPDHHSANNNTNNKRGERVASLLTKEMRDAMQRYRHVRNSLGDEPIFLSSDFSSITDAIRSGTNATVISDDYRELDLQTLQGNWETVRPTWVHAIQSKLPLVTEILSNTCYEYADSWESFVSEIYKGLHESIETTNHPYWVRRILMLSEIWFEQERKFSDMRKTGKKDRIYQLADKNVPQNEIADIVDVDDSYVSRILSKRRREQSSPLN